MASQPPSAPHSPPPAPVDTPAGTTVRRHHTISTSSRPARTSSKSAIKEDPEPQQIWDDDEFVGEEWVGSVGVVGEKTSLHRQSSLPARYNRAFRNKGGPPPSAMTSSKAMNSLSAITAEHGVEGDEGDWENEMRDWNVTDDAQVVSSPAAAKGAPQSPMSPPHAVSHIPSPPPATSGIRRHQSLNYAEAPTARHGLRRSGTTTAKAGRSTANENPPPSPPDAHEQENGQEEVYEYEEVPPSHHQQSNFSQPHPFYPPGPTSPIGGRTPWSPNSQGQDWRYGDEWRTSNQVEDISRKLSAFELSTPSHLAQQGQQSNVPRFNPPLSPGQQQNTRRDMSATSNGNTSRKLQLITHDLVTPPQNLHQGPASASAYVPPIGHGLPLHSTSSQAKGVDQNNRDERAFTASAVVWDQKERLLGTRASGGNLHQNFSNYSTSNVPPPPAIPQQYLAQVHHSGRLGTNAPFAGQQQSVGNGQAHSPGAYLTSPIDVPSMIAAKGYNPASFDIKPAFARYFVIKSYTEDDVHKSLKYEIWSSTDPGNKRLDKAFKDCAGRGPIYLFFSVNASGHFCGMAEMLTPVDYTRSSTVWASDKWKGVFKVRWIFVRDVPNATLRHIRLNNTQERKPVTNSRDTQELMADAGHEMLRIFFTHPARTSLLQDFAFYELQALQKANAQATSSVTSTHGQKMQQQQHPLPQQHPFAMPNPNSVAYGTPAQHMQMSQLSPMVQMQMGGAVGQLSGQYAQGLLRNPSPGPPAIGNQGYLGMGVTQGGGPF